LCFLVAFSSISMAASEKTVKKDNKVVQEKQTSVKGEAVNRGGEKNAKNKKISQINLARRNTVPPEA